MHPRGQPEVSVEPNSGTRPAEPERLSITHLLIWTALSAVLLAIDRATSQLPHLETSAFGQMIAFIYAPLFGAGVFALLLAAWRATNGGPRFPSQPGHWLLVISGIQSLLHLSIGLIVAVAQLGVSWELLQLGRLCEELACGTLLVLAIRDSRRSWRVAFVCGLISYVFSLAGTALMQFGVFDFSPEREEGYLHWLTLLVCLCAVFDDCLTRAPRDYLHWMGLAVRFSYLSLVTAMPYLLRWWVGAFE